MEWSLTSIPSLHALRAFEAAARLGNFVRASEELHITPSAISHQVRNLERHFGRALFVRVNRRMVMTPDGEQLHASLATGFAIIRDACEDLSPVSGVQDLHVHCTPSFASKWLGPRLPEFFKKYPAINLRMSSDAEPLDLTRQKQVDVGIAYGKRPQRSGVTVQALGREEVAALCSPEFASANASPAPKDFTNIVQIESSLSPLKWTDWLSTNDLPAHDVPRGPSFDRGSLSLAAAAQGLGLALETTRFAEAELEAGDLVRFCHEQFRSLEREMHFLCFRTRDKDAKHIRRFRDWILAEAS